MRKNTNLMKKRLVPALVILTVALIISPGCLHKETPPASTLSIIENPSTPVPGIPLDLYLYGKQDKPTVLPADIINTSRDVIIETLAIWGASAENDFAIGLGITLTSVDEAARVYERITLEEGWKKLSGRAIYLVHGSGPATIALKTAIANNNFKPYDDREALRAAATLPQGDTNNQVAVAIAKPTENLISFITRDTDPEAVNMINLILKVVNLNVIAAGLYSPGQIDIARTAEAMKNNGDIAKLDMGLVISLKSDLPGFIVKPAVRKLLTDQGFTEISVGELTLYRGYPNQDKKEGVPILIRIEDNRIFTAVSGQESYARTLISNIHLK